MPSDYLLVHKKILPDYFDKVILARNLLENHEVRTITEAVAVAGISRNTYYKYKDYIYSTEEPSLQRHAVISVLLKDEPGALASLIQELTARKTSISTISQALPAAGRANVLLSLDISSMEGTMEQLADSLRALPSVRNIHIDVIE